MTILSSEIGFVWFRNKKTYFFMSVIVQFMRKVDLSGCSTDLLSNCRNIYLALLYSQPYHKMQV